MFSPPFIRYNKHTLHGGSPVHKGEDCIPPGLRPRLSTKSHIHPFLLHIVNKRERALIYFPDSFRKDPTMITVSCDPRFICRRLRIRIVSRVFFWSIVFPLVVVSFHVLGLFCYSSLRFRYLIFVGTSFSLLVTHTGCPL